MSGTHAYGLVAFVFIDFIIALLLLTRPSKMAFTAAAAWSILRIVIQVADVYFGPIGVSYGDFANYLFNPTIVTAPNPPGIPAALIDLIIIMQVIVVALSLSARSAQK